MSAGNVDSEEKSCIGNVPDAGNGTLLSSGGSWKRYHTLHSRYSLTKHYFLIPCYVGLTITLVAKNAVKVIAESL